MNTTQQANRLSIAIAATRKRIAERLDTAGVARLDSGMAVTWADHAAYQNAQARAHVLGTLTTEEALVIYAALGEIGDPANGGWAGRTDLATKVVVTQVIGELISAGATQ
jgi:hypothetical protein